MQGFTVIDLIILIIYLAAVLFAGLHFAKKEMKGKEYFKGDGTVPWWVTSVSIFATLLSPISFLSLAGNFLCGNMDYVVRAAWYVTCHSGHHSILPADLQ